MAVSAPSTPSSKRFAAGPHNDELSDLLLTGTPLGYAGGNPNLYRYCGNGPTDSVDPSGLGVMLPQPSWLQPLFADSPLDEPYYLTPGPSQPSWQPAGPYEPPPPQTPLTISPGYPQCENPEKPTEMPSPGPTPPASIPDLVNPPEPVAGR